MSNTIRLAISGGAFAIWLFVMATLWLNDAREDDFWAAVFIGVYGVVFLNRLVKPDFGRLQTLVRWLEYAVIIPLLGWFAYRAVTTDGLSTLYPFMFFLGAWTLSAGFDAAHARWQKIRSPLTRIVVGTVFLTVVAVMALMALIYTIAKIDWPFVARNWDVTLIVVFLPLLLIGWWALVKWQGRKRTQ